MKYYFFRDRGNEKNLEEGKTFHAAGYVEKFYCELDKPNRSGKDLIVNFFEPFNGTITSTWRAIKEVELFSVNEWEYKLLVKNYEVIRDMRTLLGRDSDKDKLHDFIWAHTPIAIRPTKPAKTLFISPFTSNHAREVVIDSLTEAFLIKKNKKDEGKL